MDPSTLGMINTGAGLIKNLFGGGSSGPAAAPVGPQRADGYAIGGMLDSQSPNVLSSGATGGAYGGAYSQANIDGSNWVVSTGNGRSTGGGKSGGNGGLSPIQTISQGGIAPASPYGITGTQSLGAGSNNTMTLVLLAAVAYIFLKG